MNLPAWFYNTTLWLSLLAGLVGAIWALSEIIGEFRVETGRALRTWGACLLLAVNFVAAALIFVLVVSVVPAARTWPSALLIGFAWPTVFRNASLKLAQPLDTAKSREAAAIRFEEAYASVQKLALQLINSVLTRQRTQLLQRVLKYELDDLVKYTRRMIVLSPQQIDDELIDRVLKRKVDDEAKKAYLAALLMDNFTRSALDDFIRENSNKELKS